MPVSHGTAFPRTVADAIRRRLKSRLLCGGRVKMIAISLPMGVNSYYFCSALEVSRLC